MAMADRYSPFGDQLIQTTVHEAREMGVGEINKVLCAVAKFLGISDEQMAAVYDVYVGDYGYLEDGVSEMLSDHLSQLWQQINQSDALYAAYDAAYFRLKFGTYAAAEVPNEDWLES